VEAILGIIEKIGLDSVISSKRCPERDRVLAMIVECLIHPCSKLAMPGQQKVVARQESARNE